MMRYDVYLVTAACQLTREQLGAELAPPVNGGGYCSVAMKIFIARLPRFVPAPGLVTGRCASPRPLRA